MTPKSRWLSLFFLPALLTTGQAMAYVRTTNEQGTPISWRESCVFLIPDSEGCPDVGPPATFEAIADAVQEWNEAAMQCQASMEFHLEDPREGLKAGFNPRGKNTNVIVWLQDYWGNDTGDYDPQALALTTVTFVSDAESDQDGRILDADIEFNSVTKQFTTDPRQDPDAYDIQNDLTHELGHVLGLDHTCYDGWFSQRPTDDQGRPIPDCSPASHLSSEVKEATMYPYSDPHEITKRTLEQDDKNGLCGIYPPDRNAGPCRPVDLTDKGCGCRSTGRPPTGFLVVTVLGVWLSQRTGFRRKRWQKHSAKRPEKKNGK